MYVYVYDFYVFVNVSSMFLYLKERRGAHNLQSSTILNLHFPTYPQINRYRGCFLFCTFR